MNTADQKTLSNFGKALLIAGIIIGGLFAFHKCANAQYGHHEIIEKAPVMSRGFRIL